MPKYTVREVIEAAEKNGLKHSRGSWFDGNAGGGFTPTSGCILGQAFWNLTGSTSNPTVLENQLNEFSDPKSGYGLGSVMIGLNDGFTISGRRRTYNELVTSFKYRARNVLDKEIEL